MIHVEGILDYWTERLWSSLTEHTKIKIRQGLRKFIKVPSNPELKFDLLLSPLFQIQFLLRPSECGLPLTVSVICKHPNWLLLCLKSPRVQMLMCKVNAIALLYRLLLQKGTTRLLRCFQMACTPTVVGQRTLAICSRSELLHNTSAYSA